MANKELNLLKGNPATQFKSGRRAAELGALGGRNFGENNRKRKSMQERTTFALELLTNKNSKEARRQGKDDVADQLDECGIEVYELLSLATNKNASVDTKLKAWTKIIEYAEGVSKSGVTINNNIGSDKIGMDLSKVTQEQLIIGIEYAADKLEDDKMDEAINILQKSKEKRLKVVSK